MIRGMVAGLRALPSVHRAPVSREIFALDRRLRRKGPLPLSEIESTLTPLGEATQAVRTPRDQRSIASS
jgi:hypothetical protein